MVWSTSEVGALKDLEYQVPTLNFDLIGLLYLKCNTERRREKQSYETTLDRVEYDQGLLADLQHIAHQTAHFTVVSLSLAGVKSGTESRLEQQQSTEEEISDSSGDKCWDQDLFVSNTGSVQQARH